MPESRPRGREPTVVVLVEDADHVGQVEVGPHEGVVDAPHHLRLPLGVGGFDVHAVQREELHVLDGVVLDALLPGRGVCRGGQPRSGGVCHPPGG